MTGKRSPSCVSVFLADYREFFLNNMMASFAKVVMDGASD